jgi:hypothetical protein
MKLRISKFQWGLLLAGVLGFCLPLTAAVLPEDRADFLFHSHDGGGLLVNGPAVQVRKSIGKSVSAWGKYYVDSLTSATIDVVTAASEYTEERIEKSLGMDYLHDKSTISVAYTNSVENDFTANTVNFGISHSMFGDLTTVSLGFARGLDEVGSSVNPNFSEEARRYRYKLGVSQVITKNLLMDLAFETVTDEGHLESPYRRVRYLDATAPAGVGYESEEFPDTRTSHALGIRALYYLPYRASIMGGLRFFTDTWGVNANIYELHYTHPMDEWIFDFRYRQYSQTHADFYSDLFNRQSEFTYHGRDKELSTLSNYTIGVGASYEFAKRGWHFIDRGSVSLAYDRIQTDYKDFRDTRVQGVTPGNEPLFSQTADVVRFFVSIWY